MSKLYILTFFLFILYLSNKAQTTCIDIASKSLSDLIVKNIEKNKLPVNSKIAILLFVGSDSETDTIISRLGIRISQQLSGDINLSIYNSKALKSKNYQVLFPENKKSLLMETSQKFFRPPTSSGEETNFYTAFYNNLKPDYYLVGKYKIVGDFNQLILNNISIQSDPFNLNLKTFIPIAQVEEIIPLTEKEDIITLHTITLDEVCAMLAIDLKNKVMNIKEPLYLDNFLLMDTRITSPFSRRFVNTLKQKMVDIAGIEIISQTTTLDEKVMPKYVISGNFWEEGKSLKIITELKNTESNKVVASVVHKLPMSWLNINKISIKPDNFETAKKDEEIFNTNQVKSSGGLFIEINTNKGKNNLMYSEGEIMTLKIKANMPCYVRFIYYFANNTQVLLLDNYQITSEDINKWIDIPNQFECAEPYGVERMAATAQQDPFDSLNIQEKSGYKFIVNNVTSIIQMNKRGFKEKKQFSEVNIPITTVKE